MTAVVAPTIGAPISSGHRLRWMFADIFTITWRNLLALTRMPGAMFFSILQPIMFVLLFAYVFGGAIHIPHLRYIDFLIPGIFVQTVSFGSTSTAVGLCEDLQKGLIERFRALPMARSAVLAGRTTADLTRSVFVVALMTGVGYAVGFRIGTNVGLFLCGCLLVLLYCYALAWSFAGVGLSAPNAETAQVMVFPIIFPFTFASSAFVQVASMPGWLQAFAKNQPVTQVVNAARSLMVGGSVHDTRAVWLALAWTIGLLVVFIPLTVRKYRRVS
jgi:ABC-2 type transport system permease protein/oleandomycin transport system permease protein